MRLALCYPCKLRPNLVLDYCRECRKRNQKTLSTSLFKAIPLQKNSFACNLRAQASKDARKAGLCDIFARLRPKTLEEPRSAKRCPRPKAVSLVYKDKVKSYYFTVALQKNIKVRVVGGMYALWFRAYDWLLFGNMVLVYKAILAPQEWNKWPSLASQVR